MKRLALLAVFVACSGNDFSSVDADDGGDTGDGSGGTSAGSGKGGSGAKNGGSSSARGGSGATSATGGTGKAGSSTGQGGSSGATARGGTTSKGGSSAGGTHSGGGEGGDITIGNGGDAESGNGGEPGSGGTGGSTGGTGGTNGGTGGTGGTNGGTGGTGGTLGGTGGVGGSLGGVGGSLGGSAGTFSVAGSISNAGAGGSPPISCESGFSISNDGFVLMPAHDACWHGYAFTGGDIGSDPHPTTFSGCGPGCQFAASGSVGASNESNSYSGYVFLGFNVNQPLGGATSGSVTPTGTGLKMTYTYTSTLPARLQLQSGNTRWCMAMPASGTGVAYASFRTNCWDASGTAYAKQAIDNIQVVIPGGPSATAFSINITKIEEL